MKKVLKGALMSGFLASAFLVGCGSESKEELEKRDKELEQASRHCDDWENLKADREDDVAIFKEIQECVDKIKKERKEIKEKLKEIEAKEQK